jgi:CRISPR/Cas system-associated exonuclease Cas4 (RecB family)
MWKYSGLWALFLHAGRLACARPTQVQQHRDQFVMDTVLPIMPELEIDDKPWGLTTYANVQYVPCLSSRLDTAYDIAILGAPFDTVIPPKTRQFEGFANRSA